MPRGASKTTSLTSAQRRDSRARESRPPDQSVTISLTEAQVAQVVRSAATIDLGVSGLFASHADLSEIARAVESLDGVHYSRSTLRAILVLAAFSADGTPRALAEVAKELQYSPSTTHRYLTTWLAAGLLEQEPRSRRYKRASLSDNGAG